MSLQDLNGRPIDTADKPKLLTRGVFEGTVEFKFFKDAVEYAGECFHCTGVVAGVLRIEQPEMQKKVRSPFEEICLKKEVADIIRRRHECPVLHEGKQDVDEWLRQVAP